MACGQLLLWQIAKFIQPVLDYCIQYSYMSKVILFILLFTHTLLGMAQKEDTFKMSGSYENQTLRKILSDLESRYPVRFFYRDQWLPDRELTLNFEQQSLKYVVQKLLTDTNLNYLLYHNAVILAPESLLEQEFTETYFITRANQQTLSSTKKWATASEIISVGDSGVMNIAKQAIVTGIILDRLSGEIMAGVNLHFDALNKTIATSGTGHFRIILPTGYNLLEMSHVGYENRKVLLRVYGDAEVRLTITPQAHELQEILITGEADNSNIESIIMGITRIKPRDIRDLPAFLGQVDIIKSIITLPGVSTVGEGAGGFNVRGGSIDQNLILQDEALIFNSSHALGFFSIFNPDAIQEVTLYKGHIPARYGGRLSSVLNVSLKGQNIDNFSVKGGIGAVTSHILFEGPLPVISGDTSRRSRTTLLIGGRLTYSDWMLDLVNIPDIKNSSASFHDVNMKITHKYNENGSLSLSLYQSSDNVQFARKYGFSWGTQTASLIWHQLINKNLSSSFSFSGGENKNTSFEPFGMAAFNLNNGIKNYRLSEDFLFSRFNDHLINIGAEYTRYMISPDELVPRTSSSNIIPEKIDKDGAHEAALYFGDEFTINHLISLDAGMRFNFFQQLGPGNTFIYNPEAPLSPDNIIDTIRYDKGQAVKTFSSLEPRISLKYSLDPVSSVKLSYDRLHQYIHLISNSTAATPVDYWQVSGPYVEPETTDNFSAGYFRNYMNNTWETSLELYYRNIRNIIDYRNLPDLLLNDHIETELQSGTGRSYGAELYIRKRKGKINGWMSYTWSRTMEKVVGSTPEEKINNGRWFPSKLDRPHNLNVGFRFNMNRSNVFSANFTYLSGRPVTIPSANYIVDQIVLPDFSGRNNYRIPAYHRLDISYTIKRNIIRNKRYRDSFTISLYNVYARKNAYSIYFSHIKGSVNNAYKLSVLGSVFPSITYNFEY